MRSLIIFCAILLVSTISAQRRGRGREPQNRRQRLLTRLGRPRGLENNPGTPLNTRRRETEREREQRLEGEIPEVEGEEEPNIEEIYNPMRDAKCFNAPYDSSIPSSKRKSLFSDYVNIFEWGFNMDESSQIFSFSENGVTNNRFPGMCMRMAFHDNSVDPKFGDFPTYIANRINALKEWVGPPRFLETSGGDASVLTCRIERLHPNQNYDQTASRILFAFQTTTVPGLNGQSLMDKYRMSYADALHNCALAAISFLNPRQGGGAVSRMRFGRKDACYFSEDSELAEDILSMDGNNPLCGPTELLPPVTFSASESNNWFTSRKMRERLWLSFMGTHTTFDNFGRNDTLRQMPVPGEDYFTNYVGVPVHSPDVKETEEDAELPGCDWIVKGVELFWPMSQADCALGIDVIDAQRSLRQLKSVMNGYIAKPASWIRRDLTCAMVQLGGRVNEGCGGSKSLFGSVY
ncbi:hypothetical protein BWQ96_01114 [Gracilariopsis chorda]|uniref:Uncharacterized protein n=1 Tax=Gracilariopsis chorda TaxID=448386 RepID=A0A2V3J3E6_9FLOR|nr:hypothetical protein BWQ96_01114 [Gracilariopsis chorda]|eukprot:PXF48976.1 hypothetical protein BWQ96_01114 [Gracilariopsis chorda]